MNNSEKRSVDTVFGAAHPVRPGSPVSLVFYLNAQPLAVAASVVKSEPFTLSTTDSNAALLESGKRALLILHEGGQFAKAEAQITACEQYSEGWRIEAGQFGWEEVDRRKYPRHRVELDATIKAVLDYDGDAKLKYVQATTIDVSLGGAWLKTNDDLNPGSLVEFQADLGPGRHMRALSIVAWTHSENGAGLEFVDFLGGSRYYLHSFLSEAA